MKLTCPACNAEMTLDAIAGNDAAREALLMGLALPAPLARLTLLYLGLFRSGKRQLSWEKVVKVLADLKAPIEAGQVVCKGRIYPARSEHWALALQATLQARDNGTLKLPLDNNNYLFSVVAAQSTKADAQAAAQLEAAHEHERRYGSSVHTEGGNSLGLQIGERVVLDASVKTWGACMG